MSKKVSIIIVHYHADQELYKCLDSIKQNKPHGDFEVLVVDNDEEIRIQKELKQKFPWVKYIKSPGNVGFGSANNIGAKHAKGDYLFFLNPDTRVFPNTVDALSDFLDERKDVGVVAPLLLHPDKKPFAQQGCSTLTPIRGMVVLSFINKIFPHNPISSAYWQSNWDQTQLKEVDVIPGTAFMVKKEIYNSVKGFDEHFFLYFEEFDLCKRIREKDQRIFTTPKAKLIHLCGKGGTEDVHNINKVYAQSRFYYFKKNYGVFNALLVEVFARFGKRQFFMLLIVIFFSYLLIQILNTV